MKIFFICGSLEPGRDGVGDYSRRLCGALLRQGVVTQMASLWDHHATTFSKENQEVEGVTIIANRIPKASTPSQRLTWLHTILNDFKPDWISLQYVPYSFHPKGLPFWLPSFLKKIKGNHQWHIMFHELWIGMDSNVSLKNKCIGVLQKQLVLKILDAVEKKILNTQIDLYQYQIAAQGYKITLLPLFSNIIKNETSNIALASKDSELRFCLFGSIHYGAPIQRFITDLKQVVLGLKEKKELKFIFIGSCGAEIAKWKEQLEAHSIDYEETGFVNDEEISRMLSSCHYGISTTPYILNQKSGSLAAMFDHELPAICVARDWDVKGFKQENFLNLIQYKNQESIKTLMDKKFISSNENQIASIAHQFLLGLNQGEVVWQV
ncbi:glycosyltransferase [Flavobacterium sp. UMI-01]|uniref:glycosyltransferase n=1 Tax=Flavobacterium sp. UMI-01 TaxID=1441053 RepID=UPI001C7CC659|nr:glycosyltransferase [Flavobacterium sp. UMI-01]GIZ10049.1 hypothetical protein FUMI01_27750 [Flavobacterium sp. UMI-01]